MGTMISPKHPKHLSARQLLQTFLIISHDLLTAPKEYLYFNGKQARST